MRFKCYFALAWHTHLLQSLLSQSSAWGQQRSYARIRRCLTLIVVLGIHIGVPAGIYSIWYNATGEKERDKASGQREVARAQAERNAQQAREWKLRPHGILQSAL